MHVYTSWTCLQILWPEKYGEKIKQCERKKDAREGFTVHIIPSRLIFFVVDCLSQSMILLWALYLPAAQTELSWQLERFHHQPLIKRSDPQCTTVKRGIRKLSGARGRHPSSHDFWPFSSKDTKLSEFLMTADERKIRFVRLWSRKTFGRQPSNYGLVAVRVTLIPSQCHQRCYFI